MWWCGWSNGWLPAKVPPQPFPHYLLVTRLSCSPAKLCYLPWKETLSCQSFMPSSLAPYHSRNNCNPVICVLPTGERPATLSNSTLPKFICRHISLHWRSPVSSHLCAKNVADQLFLWDNFGLLPGKVESLLWSDPDTIGLKCTIPTDFESAKSNPHDCAEECFCAPGGLSPKLISSELTLAATHPPGDPEVSVYQYFLQLKALGIHMPAPKKGWN